MGIELSKSCESQLYNKHSLCDLGCLMEQWAYQKSLQFTQGLQEHSPILMEMMEKKKERKNNLWRAENINIS